MSALIIATMIFAQLQLGEIRGVAEDDTGAVLPGVTIELTDSLGAPLTATETDGSGRFVLSGVALGRYRLQSTLPGFRINARAVIVTSAIPIEITVRMRLSDISEKPLTIAAPETPATRASIGGESIAQIPIRNAARGLQDLIATMPGWSSEDNGLLHARGSDDGFLYVIDGIPVYERLDQLSGIAPDTSAMESVNVLTGFLPAEYGYKAGGVIDIQSKFAARAWHGSFAAARGSERTANLSANAGGALSKRWILTLGVAGQASDRFLDPVHPDNFHNHGDSGQATTALRWMPDNRAIVTITSSGGRSDYDVPNTDAQELAGQDQRQRLMQWQGSATWQHAWSSTSFSQVSAYRRSANARLNGSAADTPLFAAADRSLGRTGMLATVTREIGLNTIKIGVDAQRLSVQESFGFAITDRNDAIDAGFGSEVLAFDLRRPFAFDGESTPSLFSAFIQDDWHPWRATINAGMRFDRVSLLEPRVQVSPRVGATYRLAERTVVRGSVSRFFQPPQPANILLSSSEEARALSPFAELGGGAAIEPETQWAFDAGVTHDNGRVRLDVTGWLRRMTNAADPNVFAGTTIIFPNAVASARARGIEARIEVSGHDWSLYSSAAVNQVRQRGPITGGLFLEDDIAELADGAEFTPDHDQPIAAGAGVTWSPASWVASLSAIVQYQSGSPLSEVNDGDDLHDRPGTELVDFDRGRVKSRTIASIQCEVTLWEREHRHARVRVGVENAFDARYAYNFGNPFSGTHFGAPRTVSAGVRIGF